MSDPIFSSVVEEEPEGANSSVTDDEFGPTPFATPVSDTPEERKPERHTPRKSTADLFSMAWAGAGGALVRSGTDVPVGRVLQLEAPLAGNKIDQFIAGTWVDAILQPLVGRLDSAQELGALIAFPVLVGIYERNPGSAVVVEPLLREVISSVIIDMAPVVKKKKRDQRTAAKAMADISEAFDIPADVNPIDAILGSIFADFQFAPPTTNEESEPVE